MEKHDAIQQRYYGELFESHWRNNPGVVQGNGANIDDSRRQREDNSATDAKHGLWRSDSGHASFSLRSVRAISSLTC
jgi:hypothetical protein